MLSLLAGFFRMLLIQLLLTAMAVSMASAAPPEVGQTTKVSACQLPAASDVAPWPRRRRKHLAHALRQV